MNLRDVLISFMESIRKLREKKSLNMMNKRKKNICNFLFYFRESKSRKWWVKVDKKYFKHVDVDHLHQIRERVINEVKLNEAPSILPGYHNPKVHQEMSYFHKNIYSKNSKFFDRKSIRVLFMDCSTLSSSERDLMCMSYSFGFKFREEETEEPEKESYAEYYVISDDENDKDEDIKDKKERKIYNNNFSNRQVSEQKEDKNLKIEEENIHDERNSEEFKYSVSYMKLESPANIDNKKEIAKLTEELELTPIKSSTDMEFITNCSSYDLNCNGYYPSEIDKEIHLWEDSLKNVTNLNEQAWEEIEKNLINYQEEKDKNEKIVEEQNLLWNEKEKIDQEVTSIHQFLAWQHNLVNFKNGFADKNEEMLAEALEGMWIKEHKTKNMGDKKKFFKASIENLMQTKSELSNMFETDCKICFSTYVSEKNKVIYCDNCNESFHEKCYGIVDLNEDPNSKFYCDACQQVMESGNKKTSNNIKCEICRVEFSPLKKMDGLFFHPSCLFLNNLLKPNLGNLLLEENITTENIISKVRELEEHNEDNECEFCTENSRSGLRFKCAEPDCQRYFHTLCAYLHSNVFKIWRNQEKLEMEIRCWQHFQKRDHYRQAYLRRFFCNYKNIADLSEVEFIQIYNEEIENIREYKLEQKTSSTSIPYCEVENQQNSCSNSHSKSSKHKHKKADKDESEKVKKKHKKKEKTEKKEKETKIFIDLNSDDDQENTDCQNNSPETISEKVKFNIYNQDTQKNEMAKVEQELKDNNAEHLKEEIEKLQNDMMKKNTSAQEENHTNSSSKIIEIEKFLSTINGNFEQEFNPFLDEFEPPYEISRSMDSFEKSIISE